jgi:hypothetical protein
MEETFTVSKEEYESYVKWKESPPEDYRDRYEALARNINPDFVEDALVLARRRVTDEFPIEDALTQVSEKFPYLRRDYVPKAMSTGMRTAGKPPAISGVEAAFIARNPDIKL